MHQDAFFATYDICVRVFVGSFEYLSLDLFVANMCGPFLSDRQYS
jgi:hypothetical protein